MNGHPAQELLALYAGGELSSHERAQLTSHLNVCPGCQRTLADLQNTRQLLAVAFPEPSEVDVRTVRDGINRCVGNVQRRDRPIWLWTGIAALTVIAIFAIVVSRKGIVPPVKTETAQFQNPPPPIRPNIDSPSRSYAPPMVRVRRKHSDAGVRAITLIARGDAPPQLKLSTADPNVVILVDLNGATQNP